MSKPDFKSAKYHIGQELELELWLEGDKYVKHKCYVSGLNLVNPVDNHSSYYWHYYLWFNPYFSFGLTEEELTKAIEFDSSLYAIPWKNLMHEDLN